MRSSNFLVFLLWVVETYCQQYPIYDANCRTQNTERSIQLCTENLARDDRQNPDVAAINRKILGTSILDPYSYFTIIEEVCRYRIQYEDFLKCAYPYFENCLPTDYEELIPTFKNFSYGFDYLCKWHRSKEVTIQCYQNNTLQIPPPKERIRRFTEQVESCRINKIPRVPLSTRSNEIDKYTEDHCRKYNVGYECVEEIFGARCHRTRNHIKVFYDYLRPEICAAPILSASTSLFIVCISYLVTILFVNRT